jgi:hypothetical protein
MRKQSAYGRKLAQQGRHNEMSLGVRAVHAAKIMKAISVRRDRDAPPMPGGEMWDAVAQETARDSELKVRAALDSLMTGVKPLNPEQDLVTLNAALAIGAERMLQVLYQEHRPADEEWLDLAKLPAAGREAIEVFVQARQALNRTQDRWRERGQWGLDGVARQQLVAGVDLFADLMHASTPAQMDAAYREADRLIRKLHRKGLIG